MENKKVKRSIVLNGLDKELELSKVVEVDSKLTFIHLDELVDGTWRLVYTTGAISNIQKLQSMEIKREE